MSRWNAATGCALVLLIAATACSEPGESPADEGQEGVAPVAEVRTLAVESGLAGDDERHNLSGSACSDPGNCLLIGDEMRFARFFTLGEDRLTPGREMFLLPSTDANGKKMKESDGEGIAFADGRYYVVGSHSNNKKGEAQASRHFIARFTVDSASGMPSDLGSDETASAALQMTNLDYLIDADSVLQDHLQEAPGEPVAGTPAPGEAPKGQHGVNIEGIAIRGERTFIGFRGPVDESSGALVWELPTEALFAGEKPAAVAHRLALGTGDQVKTQGVRDLAAVSDGLLILAGPEMRFHPPAPALFFWSGGTAEPIPVELPEIDFGGDSPEAITVLTEDAASYRLLILSDGDKNSAPRVVSVAKPQGRR